MVVIRNGEIRLYPVEVRYVWPAELDLMARLAGLSLPHRWSNWSLAEIGAEQRATCPSTRGSNEDETRRSGSSAFIRHRL